MQTSTEQLVQQIHDSPMRIVLAASGGGSRAIADLLEVPGASRTLLEAVVPYSGPAMAALLGGPPDEFCSEATARAMAMAAFHRARRYESPNGATAGVACTASLASDRPKRGEHRVHLAMQTVAVTATWHLQVLKDRRSRAEEERLAGRLLLNVIAAACGVADRLDLDLLETECADESRMEAPPAWQQLLLGQTETVLVAQTPNSGPRRGLLTKGEGTEWPLVFPGSFNPLHAGHLRMIQVAHELFGQPVAAELSILNVDKPPLDYMELARRLAQFPASQAVFLSRAATFEEKSRLFPGATFVVGADTLERIANPEYYDGPAARQTAIERIASRGCRFLVFGRDLGSGFRRLGDLQLPDALRAMCREVPPETFHEDISSTTLRKSAGG
ncbi:MAG: CinA family protein [Thermoguttaceae bacterium]